MPVTAVIDHRPSTIDHRAQRCAGRGAELDASAPFKAQSRFYVLDLQVDTAHAPGLTVTHCKHRYGRRSMSF